MAIIKKSLLFTVHIVDSKITCVRFNLTGKFIKKSVYVEVVNSVKCEHTTFTEWQRIDVIKHITKIPYIGFALCAFILAMAFHYAMPTIKERQAQYERVTSEAVVNSVLCDKATCNNFDYTKGVN